MSSAAEKRAEARRRRLENSEARLARIKALSSSSSSAASSVIDDNASVASDTTQDTTIEPGPGSATPAPVETETESVSPAPAAAPAPVPAPAPVAASAPVPAPIPAPEAAPAAPVPRATALPSATTTATAPPASQIRARAPGRTASASKPAAAAAAATSAAAKPRATAPLDASSPGLSLPERAMLAQLQERQYAAGVRRWRTIHTVVSLFAAIALFIYVYWATCEIHVDGEGALANLLIEHADDLRIPAVNVFYYFLTMEAVLTSSRVLFDKAASRPPPLSGLVGLPPHLVAMTSSLQNVGFALSQLIMDACYLLVVFGVGIVVCAYLAESV
ncbi:hypothetical protein AMAG_08842 [Allomyces macrogynus ATCC 38327]|uniref:Uncharacterized protein n=1 Tax=Allomyces macrogynus (strain ATCC 38327) TaxID=578462 RepID=A0A0L0SMH3_ALLM3|nr:hypothetical protein AMAG_08842 [Allomyces macrogynus ATCC 38327]|eukprot:KNE63761.1 hypothetical protein AMAG_08842 [Allomyces macrogynus ATCC 38327]